MRRRLTGILLMSLLVVPFVVSAEMVGIGQHCWDTNFVDQIRAEAEQHSSGAPMYAFPALRWRAPTPGNYQFEATASIIPAFPVPPGPPTLRVSRMFVFNRSTLFNSNPDCTIDMAFVASGGNPAATGTATIRCTGPNATFTVPVALTYTACVETLSLAELQARAASRVGLTAAGAAENNVAE